MADEELRRTASDGEVERSRENVTMRGPRDRSKTRVRVDEMQDRIDQLETLVLTLQEQMAEVIDNQERLGDDVHLLKRASATTGGGPIPLQSKIKVKEPGTYDGSRNDKVLDNFLWDMEEYLSSLMGVSEEMKVRTAARYLIGSAKLWWRTRAEDKAAGKQVVVVDTWEQLKEALKYQFRLENSAWLARGRLRKLKQSGKVTEYVKTFSSLMLEIKDMSEEDRLYSFMEGLSTATKVELRRHNVTTVAEAIRVAERLQDFTADSGEKAEKTENTEKTRPGRNQPLFRSQAFGTRNFQSRSWPNRGPPFKPRSSEGSYRSTGRSFPPRDSGVKNDVRPGCLECGGQNHIAKFCPQKRMNAVQGDGACSNSASINGTVTNLLSVINQVKEKPATPESSNQLEYVNVLINGKPVLAMLDTGATHNYIDLGLAEQMKLPIQAADNCVKTVNSPPKTITGSVKNVDIKIGRWASKINLLAMKMDDYQMVLGQDFFNKSKAAVVPYKEILVILDPKQQGYVRLVRKRQTAHPQVVSAMRMRKAVRKTKDPVFLAALIGGWNEDDGAGTPAPSEVEPVLQEF